MRPKTALSILFLCLLMVAAAFSAGCSKPAGEEQVIRVTRNIGGREGFRRHFEAWKAAFEKANPGWKMGLTDLGDTDASAFYKTRVATGDVPEVLQTWSFTKYMVDSDMLMPLPDSFFDKFGIEKPTPYQGMQYDSQSGLQFEGIAVNKKMWVDIGATEPARTWDDLIAGLRKLKEKGYRPLVYGGRDWSAWTPLQYALKVNLYDANPNPSSPSWTVRRDKGEVKFSTDPTARLVVEKVVELLDLFAEKGALSDGYPEQQRLFYGGQGATWMMGCWIAGDLEPNKLDLDLDYWPIPSMTGKPPAFVSNWHMQNGWAIYKGASEEKRQKAMACLEALYDPGVYQLFLNAEGQFSTALKVPVKGPKVDYGPAQSLFDTMAARVKQYSLHPGWFISLEDQPPPSMKWERIMQEILSGNKDVDALLAILDDEWDRARKGQ